MNISSFLKLVEIQTKVASVIPYTLGTIYALYKFENFNLKGAVILFLSMIIFDMTTTAINNYIDYKKAIKKEGFGYEHHNAIVKDGLSVRNVLTIIWAMLIIAIILGFKLYLMTDIIVLIVGVVCFTIGVSYSFGPIPISRTPFGEIFSGLTMGFAITFLAIYIHIFNEGVITIYIINNSLNFYLNIKVVLSIILISIPVIAGISNIMLANNICDMEDDIVNKRYTLPIYIGKERALGVYKALYYIAIGGIMLAVILKVLPIFSVITLIAIIPIKKNISRFYNVQTKKDTFILSVKNFVLLNVVYILTVILGYIVNILVGL